MVRRPTGQLAGQPVGRNRLKGQAFGSVPFAFTKPCKRGQCWSALLLGSSWLCATDTDEPHATA